MTTHHYRIPPRPPTRKPITKKTLPHEPLLEVIAELEAHTEAEILDGVYTTLALLAGQLMGARHETIRLRLATLAEKLSRMYEESALELANGRVSELLSIPPQGGRAIGLRLMADLLAKLETAMRGVEYAWWTEIIPEVDSIRALCRMRGNS